MASAALSTRLTTTRWNCSRSRFTAGSAGRETGPDGDAVQAALEYRQRFAHHLVQIAAHRLRGGETRELREFVHQGLHRFHRFARWCRRTRGRCARPAAADPAGPSGGSMRSAESAMGVSGFLISCATRRATSCQAAAFWARSSSLVSSSTITKPEVSFSSSAATVTDRLQLACSGAAARSGGRPRRCGARASSGI